MKFINFLSKFFFIWLIGISLLIFCSIPCKAFETEDSQPNFSYDFQFPPIRQPGTNATQAPYYQANNPTGATAPTPEQGAGYWSAPVSSIPSSAPEAPVPECWQGLCNQLVADGFEREQVEALFVRLGSCYTDSPMRIKVTELYKSKFLKPKNPPKPEQPKPKTTYYKHVVTNKNIQRANDFLTEHKTAFEAASRQYGVPMEVAVSLILVETDLGNFFGKQKALTHLASMATSSQTEMLIEQFPAISGNATKEVWMQGVMETKSSWAYNELKAYLTYCFANNIDPLMLDGSIYGALGYCQFMPSNILLFGVDGNNNGKIDLFEIEDSIHSLCNYLKKNGWKDGLNKKQQHAVLLRYNRSNIYANTILLMAEKLNSSEVGK